MIGALMKKSASGFNSLPSPVDKKRYVDGVLPAGEGREKEIVGTQI